MNTALLRAEVGNDGAVTLSIDAGGEPISVSASRWQEWEASIKRQGSTSGKISNYEATSRTLEFARLVPEAMTRVIRQWALGDRAEPLLCVVTDAALAGVMWERLPAALGIKSLLVARLSDRTTSPRLPERSSETRVLVAGWSLFEDVRMPGIVRELEELPGQLARMRVPTTVLPEATLREFELACASVNPAILHLSSFGIDNSDDSNPSILAAGSFVSAQKLANLLGKGSHLRLLILNTCEGGSLARILSERLGITVVGWAGYIHDSLAADFSPFFYGRLAEGATVVQAMRAFMDRFAGASPGLAPVVCLPSVEAAERPIWAPAEKADSDLPRTETARAGRAARPVSISDQAAAELKVRIEFEPVSAINPALLMNGRAPIERLAIDASRGGDNLRLEIVCDAGSGRSAFRQTLSLSNGMQPIVHENIHFPILYELATQRAPRRYVNFLISVLAEKGVLAEVTKPALWMSHNEWMDRPETWAYIPAFVQPNSPGVLTILDTAADLLKKLGGPTDSFCGYQLNDPEHVELQMRAIFQTLRDAPYSLNYISPPSSPVYVGGSRAPAGQLVRFPDEIVEHKRATCHDLALLFAGCAEHVGIYPLVILIPGHTFFGFWRDPAEHLNFWRSPTESAKTGRFGSGWMIRSLSALQKLVRNGVVQLVESTEVTDRNAQYIAARGKSKKRLTDMEVGQFDAAIDVCAARHIIQPL